MQAGHALAVALTSLNASFPDRGGGRGEAINTVSRAAFFVATDGGALRTAYTSAKQISSVKDKQQHRITRMMR